MVSIDTSTDWARCNTAALETRKRDGSWVRTPVSLVTHDGRTYFRTYASAGKAKRLRNFTEVRVSPCTLLGRPLGPAVAGETRLLGPEEALVARRLLRRRHPVLQGVAVPLFHRLMHYRTLHYELTFADAV
ncbi:PPOX class F420-dependent oxidoreductase [Naasia aerilata]|uniref:PPOX class F420-dependent oxidoreductase n=1 Tax=Naasia aerilata TaxID=1162966 RepID=A0ABN6XIN3_9MICO|nr:PPOX class F420-dependent oxidoreductase [Naasia aerilata]BDZ44773.1 hypothetical protein GCM10025866_06820 [Naasia aerilata]